MVNRWKEALDLTSVRYRKPLLGLIEHLPDCVPVLFDRCITHGHGNRKQKDFHVNYSFIDEQVYFSLRFLARL